MDSAEVISMWLVCSTLCLPSNVSSDDMNEGYFFSESITAIQALEIGVKAVVGVALTFLASLRCAFMIVCTVLFCSTHLFAEADHSFPDHSSLLATSYTLSSTDSDHEIRSAFESDTTGVSFQIPKSMNTRLDKTSGAVLFSNDITYEGYALGVNDGGLTAAEILLRDRLLVPANIELELLSEPLMLDKQFQAVYRAQREGIEFIMSVIIKTSAFGNAVVLVALSSEQHYESTNLLINAVSDSVSFTDPVKGQFELNLANQLFELIDEDIQQRNSGATLLGKKEAQLLTCADTRYAYFSSDSTYVSFSGRNSVSGSTTDEDQHSGVWQNIIDFSGTQNIYLKSADRRGFMLAVRMVDDELYLNDEQYIRSPDHEQCAA